MAAARASGSWAKLSVTTGTTWSWPARSCRSLRYRRWSDVASRAAPTGFGSTGIPLYQVHQPNPVVPDSVTMRGMQRVRSTRGRIGAVGVSNYLLDRWRKADAALGRPVVSNQVQFSLARPDPLEELVPFADREHRMIMAYSPLAQGLLGGKYSADNRPSGVRAMNPLFGTENLRRVQPLLDLLRQVAAAHDAKPAQVALAWLLSLPRVVVIPGASSVEQLEFNVAAADLELDTESVRELTAAARAFRPVTFPLSTPWRTGPGQSCTSERVKFTRRRRRPHRGPAQGGSRAGLAGWAQRRPLVLRCSSCSRRPVRAAVRPLSAEEPAWPLSAGPP